MKIFASIILMLVLTGCGTLPHDNGWHGGYHHSGGWHHDAWHHHGWRGR